MIKPKYKLFDSYFNCLGYVYWCNGNKDAAWFRVLVVRKNNVGIFLQSYRKLGEQFTWETTRWLGYQGASHQSLLVKLSALNSLVLVVMFFWMPKSIFGTNLGHEKHWNNFWDFRGHFRTSFSYIGQFLSFNSLGAFFFVFICFFLLSFHFVLVGQQHFLRTKQAGC